MRHDFSPSTLRRQISLLSEVELARTRYCYQIGSTFVACALLEDSIISSMLICDRVKVAKVLNEDIARWEKLLQKQQHLQDSTLGSLLAILAKHNITTQDLHYLRWLKAKRDFFIHRFFQNGAWPGDLHEEEVDGVCRTLGALEIVFRRGAFRIMPILGRAGLMEVEVLAEGLLAFNPDFPGELDRTI